MPSSVFSGQSVKHGYGCVDRDLRLAKEANHGNERGPVAIAGPGSRGRLPLQGIYSREQLLDCFVFRVW